MTAQFINDILDAFVRALQIGFTTLHAGSLALFSILALLAWSITWLPMMIGGGPGLPAALGHLVKTIMVLVIYRFFIDNILTIGNGVFAFFSELGASVGGFTNADFQRPSTVMDMAFVTVNPIRRYILSFEGWAVLFNLPMVILYGIIFVIVLLAFMWVIKDAVMTTIEFHFAMLSAPVLIPWGVLAPTQELASWSISWILGVSVRMFLISATLGIGVPLFRNIAPTLTPGSDPTTYSGIILAFASVLFATIACTVPKRAELIAGRGMALALPGAALVPPGLIGGVRSAASRLSQAIRTRRGA